MERPSYVAALSVPLLRNQMIELPPDKPDSLHIADVLIERCEAPSFELQTDGQIHLHDPVWV
jgi:hypothetical protein